VLTLLNLLTLLTISTLQPFCRSLPPPLLNLLTLIRASVSIISPIDDKPFARLADASKGDVDRAVSSARTCRHKDCDC
jgi:hypothetical protein